MSKYTEKAISKEELDKVVGGRNLSEAIRSNKGAGCIVAIAVNKVPGDGKKYLP